MEDTMGTLHQLVSPFGKTDTACVLCETIEYIKFLQGQISSLSTMYKKKELPQSIISRILISRMIQKGCIMILEVEGCF
ncbi:hypothetical protein CDL12_11342 [Handroanthus impetiginosus]|uniref:BHLH domain-containing protein n=1 Tax=Handroanthus impetiginosus TaxID=429701 RepID=A0A2G9HEP7_9LAMI|nr:hypothetical protein CDL12_11342 [Handroanthus impetiginosus]